MRQKISWVARLRYVAFALLLVLAPSRALADGMPIENGRFVGAVTVVTLTKAQQKQLDIDRKRIEAWEANPVADFGPPIESIALTKPQRAKLRKEAGLGPKYFIFYDTRAGENDCTCHAWNRALRFSDTEAEIPHDYLVSDEEARRRKKEMEGQ